MTKRSFFKKLAGAIVASAMDLGFAAEALHPAILQHFKVSRAEGYAPVDTSKLPPATVLGDKIKIYPKP